MTGPSGNSLSAPRSIETLGEAILNLSGQIDLPITLETSHYLKGLGAKGPFLQFDQS